MWVVISCLHRWPVQPFLWWGQAIFLCHCCWSWLLHRLAGWPFQHLSTLKIQRHILKTPSILVRLPIFKIHTGDLSWKHLCEDSIEIYFYFPWDFSPNQYNIQVFLSYCRFSFCLPTAHYMIHFRKISLVVYNVWTQTRAKNMRKWNIHRVSDACLSLFYSP